MRCRPPTRPSRPPSSGANPTNTPISRREWLRGCPEHPGELDQALARAERARVGVPDPEWEGRTVRLQIAARRSVGGQARTLRALNRLGAIGDVPVNKNLPIEVWQRVRSACPEIPV